MSPTPLRAFAFVLAGLLAGCANQQAFVLGQQRMAEKDWMGAISALEQASRAAPDNAQAQYLLRNARGKAVDQLLADAALQMKVSPEKATETYRQILLIDPFNSRAVEQLRTIERNRYRQDLYQEATQALRAGRSQEARAKLRRLLVEDPGNEQARRSMRQLDEESGRNSALPTLDERLTKPVSLSVSNGSIKMLFEALAMSHNLNFILDRDLKSDATTTINLRNVPFDEALEQILIANGLDMKVVNSNTVLVFQASPQKYREHQNLLVRNFFIESADVKELGNLLKTILKMSDVHVDAKRNTLVVRDTSRNIQAAEKLIAAHDQPEPEVMLEVEILEFNHSLSTAIGLQFPSQVTWGVVSPITLNTLNALTSSNINVTGLSSLLQLNLQSQSAITRVLANPKIRIRNREKARFHVGDRVPVITSTTYPGTLTGATSSSVSYLDVGIKLELEPVIQLDGQVVIKTTLEDSSITDKVVNSGTTAYQLGTRNVATTLTLRDGEMQILAGLIRSGEQTASNQVPGLSDLPVLGRLFQTPANSNTKKEILLSITPRILKNIQSPTDDLMEMTAGPESRTGQVGRGTAPPPASPPQVPRPAAAPVPPRPILTPLTPFGQSNSAAPAVPVPAPMGGAMPTNPAPSGSPAGVGTPPQENFPIFQPPPGVGSSGG